MAQIARLKVEWTGFIGAPGYTNLHFRDFSTGAVSQSVIDNAILKTDTWLDSFVPIVPTVCSFKLSPVVEIINEATGALEEFATGAVDTTRVGTSAGVYVAGTGACINWYTNVIRGTRRMRGRTFIVPLGLQAMTNDGTIDDTRLAAMKTATNTFINGVGDGDLGVWGRPNNVANDNGTWAVVSTATINDRMAQLRSRRA